jgi:hypothetical protein
MNHQIAEGNFSTKHDENNARMNLQIAIGNDGSAKRISRRCSNESSDRRRQFPGALGPGRGGRSAEADYGNSSRRAIQTRIVVKFIQQQRKYESNSPPPTQMKTTLE